MDSIDGFSGSFDYTTISELIEHLLEHAERVAGGSAGDAAYDPETLCLEQDAANAIALLNAERIRLLNKRICACRGRTWYQCTNCGLPALG